MIKQILDQIIENRSLLKHPFYQAWQKGELTFDDLKTYAKEYYALESNFPRLLSAVHSNMEDHESRGEITKNLASEEIEGKSHRELWLDFAQALGLNKEEVIQHKPSVVTQETLGVLRELCSQKDWKIGLAALYAYESQQPQVALTKREGLARFYKFDPNGQGLEFFKTHEEADRWHSQAEVQILNRAIAPESDDLGAARDSAGQAAKALWQFLDGVSEQIGLEKRVSCSLN